MFRSIKNFSQTRFCWLLLFLLSIGLEGSGLYFQYGLHLDPCVNCVYERAYILGFLLAGIIGIFLASFWPFRLIAVLTLLASSVGGIVIAIEHLQSYTTASNLFSASCKLAPSFPSYLKLDEWLPWMFKASGNCGPLDWSFMTLNMPQWLVIIFGCGIMASVLMLLSFFVRTQRRSIYDRYYR